ncbi:MAG TPA: DsbE family thiol:disulfide interchange protein [Steroidobacteraceae bacterium]|jgi:cytochrome c biogenesis protein CcmG/thiol:disulfide interchange protein DsbE|nr:DsbE family thiol:disulfide interchange protein [Steroidobacteraceae bacterium]
MNQQIEGAPTQPQEPEKGSSRWRFALPLGLFAALLIVLFVGLMHSPEKDLVVSPLVGKAAPQFSLPNLVNGGQPVSNAALRGHWSLVNVWGTWCANCRDEHQTLLMIKQQGRVPIIGIDWNDNAANATTWLQQLGDPYTQVGEDPNGVVAIDWGVYGAPESFLVNPQGVIVYKEVGEITPDVWREQFLTRIDAAPGTGPPPTTGED